MKEEIHITDGLPHSNTVEELINVIWDMEKEKEELIRQIYREKVKSIQSDGWWFGIGMFLGFLLGLSFYFLN